MPIILSRLQQDFRQDFGDIQIYPVRPAHPGIIRKSFCTRRQQDIIADDGRTRVYGNRNKQ